MPPIHIYSFYDDEIIIIHKKSFFFNLDNIANNTYWFLSVNPQPPSGNLHQDACLKNLNQMFYCRVRREVRLSHKYKNTQKPQFRKSPECNLNMQMTSSI